MKSNAFDKHLFSLRLLLFAWCISFVMSVTSSASPTDTLSRLRVLESQGETALALEVLDSPYQPDDGAPLEADIASREALRARLRLLVRARRHEEARDLLVEFGERLEGETVGLVGAVLSLRQAEPESALQYLAGMPETTPALERYATFLKAEALHGLRRWPEVLESIDALDHRDLSSQMKRRLRMIEGHAALGVGNLARLQPIAEQLGRDARSDDRNGLILHELARQWLDVEETREQAIAWLRQLLESRPDPADAAYRTLRQLIHEGRWQPNAEDQLQLARYEIGRRRYRDARTRLQRLLDVESLERVHAAEAWATIAESYQRQGHHRNCLETLEAGHRTIRGTPSEPERLRLKARSTKRLGNEPEAIALYEELARRFPGHPRADDALYEAGWRHEIKEDFAAAKEAYHRLSRVFPRSNLADDAVLREGLSAMRSGDMEEALSHFRRMIVRYPNSNLIPRALYWRLWIHEQQGDFERVGSLRHRLLEEYPFSYYSVLASHRGGEAVPQPSTGAALTPEQATELAHNSYERYMLSIQQLRKAPRMELSPDFRQQSVLWRFLLDHGIDAHALWETKRLERHHRKNPAALLELLAGCYSRGLHERLISLSYTLSLMVPEPELAGAIEILRYPAPYSLTLARTTAEYGLSHAAILALMRHESAFNPQVDSHAGARGLMQLMPAVGRRLARRLGHKNMPAEKLYDPETNMRLGCLLLSEELKRADGSWPQALAAYNAGGNPAELWATRIREGEPRELYIDVAEYYETRSYMERVLGSYEVYRRLYGLP